MDGPPEVLEGGQAPPGPPTSAAHGDVLTHPSVVSSDIRVMQIIAGVREIWGIKQESGHLRCRFSYLLLAIFSESSSPRLKLLYSNTYSPLLASHSHGNGWTCNCCNFDKHDKLTPV